MSWFGSSRKDCEPQPPCPPPKSYLPAAPSASKDCGAASYEVDPKAIFAGGGCDPCAGQPPVVLAETRGQQQVVYSKQNEKMVIETVGSQMPQAGPVGSQFAQAPQQKVGQGMYQQQQQAMAAPIGHHMGRGGGGVDKGPGGDCKPLPGQQGPINASQYVLSQETSTTIRVLVTKTFSLQEASNDPASRCWESSKPRELFGRKSDSVKGQRRGNLSTTVLSKVGVYWMRSEFDVTLGVKITGVPGNTYNEFGNRYALIIPPTQGQTVIPINGEGKGCLQIFKPSNIILSQLFSMYAGLTIESLNDGIHKYNADMWHVKPSHIVVKLLEMNKHRLGNGDMDKYNKYQGNYELPAKLVSDLIERIKTDVLDKLPYVDMNRFKVSFARADVPYEQCDHFIVPEGELRSRAIDNKWLASATSEPRTVSFLAEITFSITSD